MDPFRHLPIRQEAIMKLYSFFRSYQDEAYAKRYVDLIKRVVAAEAKAVPGQSGLSEAAARYLYMLMAYKVGSTRCSSCSRSPA